MKNNNNSQFNPLHHRLAHIDASLRHACNSVTSAQQSLDDDRRADGAMAAELFNLDRILTQLERHMRKLTPEADQATPPDSPKEHELSDPRAQTENGLLLQALDAQEARIRELEAEIDKLREDDWRMQAKQTGSETEPPEILSSKLLQPDSADSRMIVTIQDGGNLKVGLNSGITTIGREPANDLQIRSRFVSRFHARIVNDDDGAIIEDLDSRNGITVNTDAVSRRRLRSGDYIRIGRTQLQYIDIMEGSYGSGA